MNEIVGRRKSVSAYDAKDDDPISPSMIRHEVDEIAPEGVVEMIYNFLTYEFERDGAVCTAKAYLDSIGEVAIFGPFASRDGLRPSDAPEFKDDVLAYLKRRFGAIEELGEERYHRIWERG